MRKSTMMPRLGRPAVGTVPCVLLALASAACPGERRLAAGEPADRAGGDAGGSSAGGAD